MQVVLDVLFFFELIRWSSWSSQVCLRQQATGGGGGRIIVFGLVEGNTYRKP